MRGTNRRFSPLPLKSSTNLSPSAIRANFVIVGDLDQSLENGGKLTPQPGMHTPIPVYSGLGKVERSRTERPLATSPDHPSSRQLTPAGRYLESHIPTKWETQQSHRHTRAHHPSARADHVESHYHEPKAWCLRTCRPSPPKP